MRRRGWTYFQIEGDVDDEPLTGYGRIPFFYNASKDNPAWMVLKIGNRVKITDTQDAALIQDGEGRILDRYAGHRFFKGLLRPWMGMHTIDTVRRDAARQEIPFETLQLADYYKSGSEADYFADVKVICSDKTDKQAATIEYLVDMDGDVLKSVKVEIYNTKGRAHHAILNFTYLQDISKMPAECTEPQDMPTTRSVLPDNGVRWLIDLANNTLKLQ
jgi:hypothetical protein